MLNELSNQEKINILNFKLFFWLERLKENNDSIDFLNSLKDEVKINQNAKNIEDINAKISLYQQEIDRLN